MAADTIGKVREITLSAISPACPIVAVGLGLLSVETHSGLQSPAVGREFLQCIEAESHLGVVRDDRNDARSTLIMVVGYKHLSACFALPLSVTLVPNECILP